MDIVALIEVLGGVFVGTGMVELIKLALTRKEQKKAAVLENVAKEQEIQKDLTKTTVDEWERLSSQLEHDVEYYRSMIADKDLTIAEKDKIIDDLKDQVNYLTSSVTQAQMLRCDKIACGDRIPPFGYKKINFRTGELED